MNAEIIIQPLYTVHYSVWWGLGTMGFAAVVGSIFTEEPCFGAMGYIVSEIKEKVRGYRVYS